MLFFVVLAYEEFITYKVFTLSLTCLKLQLELALELAWAAARKPSRLKILGVINDEPENDEPENDEAAPKTSRLAARLAVRFAASRRVGKTIHVDSRSE